MCTIGSGRELRSAGHKTPWPWDKQPQRQSRPRRIRDGGDHQQALLRSIPQSQADSRDHGEVPQRMASDHGKVSMTLRTLCRTRLKYGGCAEGRTRGGHHNGVSRADGHAAASAAHPPLPAHSARPRLTGRGPQPAAQLSAFGCVRARSSHEARPRPRRACVSAVGDEAHCCRQVRCRIAPAPCCALKVRKYLGVEAGTHLAD